MIFIATYTKALLHAITDTLPKMATKMVTFYQICCILCLVGSVTLRFVTLRFYCILAGIKGLVYNS